MTYTNARSAVPTHIDFYVLKQPRSDALRFACRLTEKAFTSGHRVYIDAIDTEQARQLDELLWTFSDISFVPHGRCAAGRLTSEAEPVSIGDGCPPDELTDVLLTLRPDAPEYFSRFERVLEIVPGDPEGRARARQRYRFYQDHGVRVETHHVAA